jgi:hypothetical protein
MVGRSRSLFAVGPAPAKIGGVEISCQARADWQVQNGEIGWVGRDEIVEEMEDAAFRLKVGEVSDVIVSPYGFHIVQVTEQRQVSGALQVHLYAIFIKGPDVDQTISAQLRQHRPIILERGLRWDAETGRVAER